MHVVHSVGFRAAYLTIWGLLPLKAVSHMPLSHDGTEPTNDENPGNRLGFYNFICRQRFKLGLSTFRVLVLPSKFPGSIGLIAFVTSLLISPALAAEEAGIVLKI